MNSKDNFEHKINEMLDQSVDELDQDISRKLQQARYAAIEKANTRSLRSFFPKPAMAVFAVAAVSLVVFFNATRVTTIDTLASMETDIELLTANESFDFIEDLEFIEWLAESEQNAS